MSQILILSDGRMGHLNQSLAFARYLAVPYTVVDVKFKNAFYKLLSYLFDRAGMYTTALFTTKIPEEYSLVVGTGSSTYYAVKTLAKKQKAKSVSMMLPKGYRCNFDLIFAQSHDLPSKQKNIVEIPANFSYSETKGLYRAKKPSVGIVIGGDNKIFTMHEEILKKQLDFIVSHYPGYEIAVSTSPRTSKKIEVLIKSYAFDYEVIFSNNPVNPIPDFLDQCETVFITGDSTSMISDAIAYGSANVVVLPLERQGENKFSQFVEVLEKENYLHIFDGSIEKKNRKIDFRNYIEGIDL